MNTAQDILNLANKRLLEAQCLLSSYCPEGAYYLAGYVVELTLKAHICKLLDIDDFYASTHVRRMSGVYFTHDLNQLLTLSGWRKRLENEIGVAGANNLALFRNWQLISQWNEQKRYEAIVSDLDVKEFIDALTDPLNGFLVWAQRNW